MEANKGPSYDEEEEYLKSQQNKQEDLEEKQKKLEARVEELNEKKHRLFVQLKQVLNEDEKRRIAEKEKEEREEAERERERERIAAATQQSSNTNNINAATNNMMYTGMMRNNPNLPPNMGGMGSMPGMSLGIQGQMMHSSLRPPSSPSTASMPPSNLPRGNMHHPMGPHHPHQPPHKQHFLRTPVGGQHHHQQPYQQGAGLGGGGGGMPPSGRVTMMMSDYRKRERERERERDRSPSPPPPPPSMGVMQGQGDQQHQGINQGSFSMIHGRRHLSSSQPPPRSCIPPLRPTMLPQRLPPPQSPSNNNPLPSPSVPPSPYMASSAFLTSPRSPNRSPSPPPVNRSYGPGRPSLSSRLSRFKGGTKRPSEQDNREGRRAKEARLD